MIYKLTNWSTYANPYQAPEVRKLKLQGNLQTAERFGFYLGEFITTSSIVGKDAADNIVTRNSVYSIADADIDPNYAVEFPDAKARLLATLPLIPTP